MRSRRDIESELLTELRKALALEREDKRTPEQQTLRTQLLERAASLSVELREHFLTAQGKPDWAATSSEYRAAIQSVYGDAGYSPEERRKVQTSVRYHSSKALRERLSPEELSEYGLRAEATPDRSREGRQKRKELVQAAKVLASVRGRPGAELVRSAAGAVVAVNAITAEQLAASDELVRVRVRGLLEQLVEHAQGLLGAENGAARR